MPRLFVVALVALALGAAGCTGPRSHNQQSNMDRPVDPQWYVDAWLRVDSLDLKELPRSARDVVDDIYEVARRDQTESQLIKALLYRSKYRYILEDGDVNLIVADLKTHIASSSAPASAILQSMLGDVYWNYLQNNRYRFYGRTPTVGAVDSDDLATWDLSRLVAAALESYRASVADADALVATPIDDFDVLVVERQEWRHLRPTLFDLLAHRALDVFENSEAGLTQPIEPFAIDAPTFLVPARQFVGLRVSSPDSLSLRAAAVRLHQALIRVHLAGADSASPGEPDVSGDPEAAGADQALVHADLRRLRFVREQSLGSDGTLYVRALETLATEYAGSNLVADIRFDIAEELVRQGNSYRPGGLDEPRNNTQYKWARRDALVLCREIENDFPGTLAATNCRSVGEGIQSTQLGLESEGAIVPGQPSLLRVTFRNVPTLYVRVYRLDKERARVWNLRRNPQAEEEIDQLLRDAEPVQATEYALPVDGDFHTHSTEVVLHGLDAGAYLIVAADRADLNKELGVRFVGRILASRLSFFHRNGSDGSITLHVVDRETGAPKSDVDVIPYAVTRDRTIGVERRLSVRTDQAGRASLRLSDRQAFLLEFQSGDDWLVSESTVSAYGGITARRSQPLTRFFTDRAIYRPGQQVYFKAILLQQSDDRYVVRANAETSIRFIDVNGREVSRLNLRSNEFGTVSGQFTAPTGGLTGFMTIMDDHGSEAISVEEYKRPRFEVELKPFAGTAAFGDDLMITGEARSFAGAPIDAAQVAYRVQRSVYFPWYRGWWGGGIPRQASAEVARGEVTTDADGRFQVPFNAIVDPSVNRSHLPVYTYSVSVDVTDLSGEARSATSHVRIGERSMVLSADVPGQVLDRSRTKRLEVSARSLDGERIAVNGEIQVSKLTEPASTQRPRWQPVDTVSISADDWVRQFPHLAFAGSENPETWPVASSVVATTFESAATGAPDADSGGNGQDGNAQDGDGAVELSGIERWELGMYRIELTAIDDRGRTVTSVSHFRLMDSSGDRVPGTVSDWHHLVTDVVEPGDNATFVYGSSNADAQVLVETEVRGEIVSSEWVPVSQSQKRGAIQITEAHRGNIAIHTTVVRNNQMLSNSSIVQVPWSNKELTLKWGTFRDKLEPGQDETWTLRIGGSRGEAVASELVATLYDASLEQFRQHDWSLSLWPNYGARRYWNSGDYQRPGGFRRYSSYRPNRTERVWRGFDELNAFGFQGVVGGPLVRGGRRRSVRGAVPDVQDMVMAEAAVEYEQPLLGAQVAKTDQESDGAEGAAQPQTPVPPPLRANFDETAFFLPHLRADANGETIITFRIPEALTRWRFLGLAHTSDLKVGQIEAAAVTQRELMISANVPRFLRQGDDIVLTATVDNLSDASISGTAGLELLDAMTMTPLKQERLPFAVEAGRSSAVEWRYTVPDNVQVVTYRVDADSPMFTDGEESILPVLTNRILVTESLPLPMRDAGTRSFRFDRLLDLQSPTLRHERVLLEYTANPAWYAVQALPYMMEYPHECAEQVFSRFYANGIATYLVEQNPGIRDVFAAWERESAPSLASNLERNQDLKALLLEETPWVREAKNESERKKRIATLFDFARMRGELVGAIDKLQQMQLGDGAWPWFAGGMSDRYVTQHIVKGIGSLERMGVMQMIDDSRPRQMAVRAIAYLDAQLESDYKRLVDRKVDLTNQQIGWIQLHALYARSFFSDLPLSESARIAYDYYMGQLSEFAFEYDTYGEGMASLVLHRAGNGQRAAELIASLREKAQQSDELGMFWKLPRGWWWYEAPVETQALLIEAFSEVAEDDASVAAMQLWLLKQKQTQDWKTTRATADAVYALLLRGTRLLDNPGAAVVTLGGVDVSTESPAAEAGTGYITASWTGAGVERELGEVTVTKSGPGPAWGALYWQYFEDLDRITAAETPLSLEKELFVRRGSDAGPVLHPIDATTELHPGDLVTVRVVVRVDRDMEYVHLKDMRASGFEPVNVLSGYRWTDGLGYYESTRDAATNFFISYLRKGTYVFEYPLRVRHAGDFSNGITTIQSMYAPEFAAHSRGVRVRVTRD